MLGILIAASLYTVKPGDTLWGLVGNRWPSVCEQNHLENCNLIYVGEQLNVGQSATTSSVVSVGNSADVSSNLPDNSASLSGTLSCSGLEQLWNSAGGNPGAAFMAAEIAEAESGGQQYATGPNGERGYWQINPVNGSLSTYDPLGNAHAAIVLSFDGSNWSAWTTYLTGAYIGRCLNG